MNPSWNTGVTIIINRRQQVALFYFLSASNASTGFAFLVNKSFAYDKAIMAGRTGYSTTY